MDSMRRTLSATTAALIGFAANSLLCRMALGAASIDAWSFTAARLCAGAVTLAILMRIGRRDSNARGSGSFASAFALFAYAACFSLAYLRIPTGVGALVLFGSVQATMIGWGVLRGERPRPLEWVGVAVALGGLALLAAPGAVAPDLTGVVLMVSAGVAWGAYSLRGRKSTNPLASTADNFVRGAPMALVGLAIGFSGVHVSSRGLGLAVLSGAVASGIGYSLWYYALPGLTATRAALVQLLVPVLAAGAGVVVLGEGITPRLSISASMILGGVALAVIQKQRPSRGEVAAPSREGASAVGESR